MKAVVVGGADPGSWGSADTNDDVPAPISKAKDEVGEELEEDGINRGEGEEWVKDGCKVR